MRDWPMVPLGEVLAKSEDWIAIHPDHMYKEVTVRLWGNGATLRRDVLGAEIASPTRLQVHANQFIISRIDARNGASGLIPQDLEGAVVSNDFPVFTPDPTRLEPRFLGWLTKTKDFVELCKAASEGTTNRVRLKEDRFLAMAISLPTLPEQRRLVERLDALAVKIEEAKRLRIAADQQSSTFLGLVVKEIFEQGKAAGWEKYLMGDIITEASYGTSEKTSDDETGVPILRMGNIQDGRLRLTDLKYLHLSSSDRAKYILERGDILVNRTNSAELVGKSAVFDHEGDYGYASYIIRLRVDTELSNPRLVAHYINSPIGRAYMLAEKKQMTGQANVNTVKLRAMPIFLPARQDQDDVLEHIEQLRVSRQDLLREQHLVSLEVDAMLPAILARAFRGELL